MKSNKYIVTCKQIGIVFFLMFLICFILFFILSIFDELFSNRELLEYIIEVITSIAAVNGLIAVLFWFLYLILGEKRNFIKINKKSVLVKYISSLEVIVIIILSICLGYNNIVNYFSNYQYKDLLFSLNDNSNKNKYVSESDLTKDYYSLNSKMFLGYKFKKKEIIESYICLYKEKDLTCLKAFDKTAYKDNVKKIKKYIGKSNCVENDGLFICYNDNMNISINKDNSISIDITYDNKMDICNTVLETNNIECSFKKDFD